MRRTGPAARPSGRFAVGPTGRALTPALYLGAPSASPLGHHRFHRDPTRDCGDLVTAYVLMFAIVSPLLARAPAPMCSQVAGAANQAAGYDDP